MSAPSEVYNIQLVRIRPIQSVASSIEVNSALMEVTK